MIRHSVLVRFRPDLPGKERLGIFVQLAALDGVVPGMLSFHAGENCSPEQLGRGYLHGFSIDFKDQAARDAYLVHPDHKAAGARLVNACLKGIDDILVFDLEL
jgi:Stress responsive A/B Barrel Domain